MGSSIMAVLLNGIAQLEYDRTRPLSSYQQDYLDDMDKKMDSGIDLDGVVVEKPDANQRAQFVAANLHHAIRSDDEGACSALCTYLATRMPDLKQIKIVEDENQALIEFIFDDDYSQQAMVNFVKH